MKNFVIYETRKTSFESYFIDWMNIFFKQNLFCSVASRRYFLLSAEIGYYETTFVIVANSNALLGY